jgi:hypothetical protein
MAIKSGGTLSCPFLAGKFDMIDRTDVRRPKKNSFSCIRVLVNNAVSYENCYSSWLDEYNLEICVTWPIWFANPHLMCSLVKHPDGSEVFNDQHPMVTDQSIRAMKKQDTEGEIRDPFVITYDEPMEMAFVDVAGCSGFDLLDVTLPDGKTAKMLQIMTKAKVIDDTPQKQRATQRSGTVGTPQRGTTRPAAA